MPFSDMFNIKVSIAGSKIEDYTDVLAIAFNAQNIRSSKDTAYIKQTGLFGVSYAVKPVKADSTEAVSAGASIGIDKTITDAASNGDLIKVESLNAIDDLNTDAIFKTLILHNCTCTGTVYDLDVAKVIELYTDTQIFWKRYRLINQNINQLSKDFIFKNRDFTFVKSSFGESDLVVPGKLSIPGNTKCLFSEGGTISMDYKTVPISNGLEKEFTVSFGYTLCEIKGA